MRVATEAANNSTRESISESRGDFMTRTVMESRSSRSTRSLAISNIDRRWPTAGNGTNTSSAKD